MHTPSLPAQPDRCLPRHRGQHGAASDDTGRGGLARAVAEADLWAWLQEQDTPTLLSLLAVCVARTADAGRADWTKAHGAVCIQAQAATAAGLDMRGCWTATMEGYLGRVPRR